MQKYTFEYRGICGQYLFKCFCAANDIEARTIAHNLIEQMCGYCPALWCSDGRYIQL